MNSQKSLVYVTIGIIVLLAIVVLLLPKSESDATQPDEQENNEMTTARPMNAAIHRNKGEEDMDNDSEPKASVKTAKALEREQKIARLHELLDNEEKQQEALNLAIEMSTGNEEERDAALDVFSWVGGAESVKALIPMLKSNGDSAERADMTLRDLIQQNMFEDSKLIDEKTWMEIINALDSDDAVGEYLTLLTSFDVKEAVPVLLNLFDDQNKSRKKLACEYMEFVAGGETITNKEQAEAWFQKYLKEQQEEEQEQEE